MKIKLFVSVSVILIIVLILFFVSPGALYTIAINIERSLAGLTKKTIEVDNHTIVFLEGGHGENVLLVHGFSADKDNWTKFAKYLIPKYHVFAIDLPGSGESSKIETESYSIAEQVKRLKKIVDALKLDKFHIAGNSMGGSIAGKFTVDSPGRVLSLALLNTAGIFSCKKSEFVKLIEKGENPLLINSPEDFDKMMEFLFVKPPYIPDPLKLHLTEQSILNKNYNEKIMKVLIKERYILEPDLSRIKVKTFILWGDSDRLIDVSCVKVLEKGLVNNTTVIMKNCGHLPMIERPKEAAGHYLKFISENRGISNY